MSRAAHRVPGAFAGVSVGRRWGAGLFAATTAGLLLFAVGCDEAAQNRGEASRLLNEAIVTIQKAGLEAPAEPEALLSEARLSLLQEAVPPLTEAAEKGGDSQRAQARILLARIDAQAGEAAARTAARANAQSRFAVAGLLAELATIDDLANTARAAQLDPAEAVAAMEQRIAERAAVARRMSERVDALQASVDTLDDQIDEQRRASVEAFNQQSRLRSEAFGLNGQAKFAVQNQATEAERRANAADVAARALQIDRDQAALALELAERELAMAEAAVEQFTQTRNDFERAGRDAQATVQTLMAERASRAEEFVADVEAAADAFVAGVTGPMSEAIERLQSAVDHASQAGRGLRGAEQNAQRAAHLSHLHVLSQTLAHAAQYHADMQASLATLAARSAFEDAPELRARIAAKADALSGSVESFRTRAAEAVAAAQGQLDGMNADDELVATIRASVDRIASELDAG